MKKRINTNEGIKHKNGFAGQFIAAIVIGFLLTLIVNLIMCQSTSYETTLTKLSNEANLYVSNTSSKRFIDSYILESIIKNKFLKISSKVHELSDSYGKHNNNGSGETWISKIAGLSISFTTIALLTLKVLLAKIAAVLVAFALFVSSGLIGLLDGLVQRYKRTMQAGRESTFMFHHISRLTLSVPVYLIFIYIITPVYINPIIINLSIASLLFSGFRIYGANLKKYM